MRRGDLGRDLSHALLVGRVEFRRSLRRARTETNVLVGLGLSAVVLAGATGVTAGAALMLGDRLVPPGELGRRLVRTAAVAVWLLAAVMVAFRVVGETGRVDGEAGLLTATSPRSVVAGLLLAELYRLLAYAGGPVVVVAAALGAGTGDPVVALAVLASAAVVCATAIPGGYLAGVTGLYLSASVPFVHRNRVKLAALVMVAYLGAIVVAGDVVLALADTPLAWLADPVLVTLGAGDPVAAGVALAAPLVLTPLAVAGAVRVATATWYADPPATDDEGDDDTLLAGVDALLAPVASRPTVSVARKTLLRARRAPHTLTYAFVPALGVAGYVAQIVRMGVVPDSFPVLTAAYAGWAVGSAFTLNPLGDEGALLPVTLSTGISGAQFVRGRVLAAWVVGLPLVVLAVAAGAVAAAVPPWLAAGCVLYGLVFAAGTPLVSAGVGVAFPKFDTRSVLGSREAVMPSVFAFLVFAVTLLPLGLPGALALAFAGPVGGAFGLSPAGLAAAGVAATAALCLGAGVPAYLFAVKRFDDYDVD